MLSITRWLHDHHAAVLATVVAVQNTHLLKGVGNYVLNIVSALLQAM